MYQRYSVTCLGLAALLLAVVGCSVPMPTEPDALGATGIGVTGVAPPSIAGNSTTLAQPGAGPPPFVFPNGCCYYDNTVVRTVVPPASNPRAGRDNFYGITNGVAGQKGVVGVAPGDTGYHGGHWKFHAVTFTVAPYLLTSEAAVLAARAAGHVTITRDPNADFKCPIQP